MSDQSPIDLSTTAQEVASSSPHLAHRPARWRWDTGEYVHGAAPVGDAGQLQVDGLNLPLVEVHAHSPSEHTWDGQRRDGEIHVVHTDGDHIAVLAIGLTTAQGAGQADVHCGPVQDLLDGEGSVAGLITTRSAATYIGSKTTPPFDPGVRWFVLLDPLPVASEQLAALVGPHGGRPGGNARPLQPIGDRRPAMVELAVP